MQAISHLHVEASTHCNARCPGCPRNIRGYSPEGFLTSKHLSPDVFRNVRRNYNNLRSVNFNGNLGDPMMNSDIVELTEIADCEVTITTNGSIGTRRTFELLAKSKIQITFSIDGLEDTNHLYRQDVEWRKVMQRVRWFIDSGGSATWKWVPFRHNNHQVEQARELLFPWDSRIFGVTINVVIISLLWTDRVSYHTGYYRTTPMTNPKMIMFPRRKLK